MEKEREREYKAPIHRVRCKNCGDANATYYVDKVITCGDGETQRIHLCSKCNAHITKCRWRFYGDTDEHKSHCNEMPLHPMITASPLPYCRKHYLEWKDKISKRQCKYGKECRITHCKYSHIENEQKSIEEQKKDSSHHNWGPEKTTEEKHEDKE